MGFTELFLIAVGLSMDAFAVSVCKGLGMRNINNKGAFVIALFFGGFQALMPLLGWVLGNGFQKYIVCFDHWIAFSLLSYIGGKMIYEAVGDKESEVTIPFRLDMKELLMLSVATSVDALAVGITLAFLKVNIFFSVLVIGVVTFAISLSGVYIGHRFGSAWEKKAEIFGGIILMLIGVKILIEHLFFG